jgi:hypothetical protein
MECWNCGKESHDEMFCMECEDDNFYLCSVCEKPKNSEMHPVDGNCVCHECFMESEG